MENYVHLSFRARKAENSFSIQCAGSGRRTPSAPRGGSMFQCPPSPKYALYEGVVSRRFVGWAECELERVRYAGIDSITAFLA